MTLAVTLHAQTDLWGLLALVGPFAIVFGAGVVLIIIPIVRAQGERYRHRELRAGEQPPSGNGNGSTAADAAQAKEDPNGAETSARTGR